MFLNEKMPLKFSSSSPFYQHFLWRNETILGHHELKWHLTVLEFYLGVCSITYKGCLISGFLLLLLSTLPLVFLIQIEDYIGEYHLSSDVRREMRSRQVVIQWWLQIRKLQIREFSLIWHKTAKVANKGTSNIPLFDIKLILI